MARQQQREISSGMAGISMENHEAAGIPDSPIFTNTSREERAIDEKLLAAHVGGFPVCDLPLETQLRLMYRQTDEGIAEANAGKSEVRARTTMDEMSKACHHRKDDIIDRGMEPWEATDPAASLVAEHVAPGFKGKLLSASKIDKDGTRGYEILRHANGDPVKLRNMVLGQMPQERVNARNRHYQDKSAQAEGNVKGAYLKEGPGVSVDDK